MVRCAAVLFVLASCKSGSKPPAPLISGSGTGSGASPPSAAFATPLRGPFASLDAYCETRPKTDEYRCTNTNTAPTGTLPEGLLEAAALFESNEPYGDLGCAIALRTSAGWFVTPPSAVTCHEPSYIDLHRINVETDDQITAITFDIEWHTKNGEDHAWYKLTALCGVGGGTPACTPVFLSQCEANAPVQDCDRGAFELTWTIDGDSATFAHDRTIDNEHVPTGTRRIVGDHR